MLRRSEDVRTASLCVFVLRVELACGRCRISFGKRAEHLKETPAGDLFNKHPLVEVESILSSLHAAVSQVCLCNKRGTRALDSGAHCQCTSSMLHHGRVQVLHRSTLDRASTHEWVSAFGVLRSIGSNQKMLEQMDDPVDTFS